MPSDTTRLLTTNEAADRLNITPHALHVWRCTKRYPLPYVKVGRLVRYRERDISQFIETRLHGEVSNV